METFYMQSTDKITFVPIYQHLFSMWGLKIKAVTQEASLAALWVGGHVGMHALLQSLFPSVSNLNLIREVALPALIQLAYTHNREQDNQQE